jgi:hypothetical protein
MNADEVAPDDFEARYAAAIPTCCGYQTLREHVDALLLCWGLVAALRVGKPMDCTGCYLRRVP